MGERLRVIQCGNGMAGKQAIGAVLERPDLELVGLLVHSEPNEGRDAASFVDMPDCGVRGTRDKEAIFAIPADVVVYMMLVPSLDDICRFLALGRDVVTTAGFMFPCWNDPEADRRLRAACEEGGSSFYVSGVNPGFVDEVLPLTLSVLSRDWRQVRISEFADCSKYPHKGIIEIMGFGFTPEDIAAGKVADMSVMTRFFEASVAALARSLGVELDEVRQTREFVLAKDRIELACGPIEPGTVAGQRWRWAGIAGGEERIVQETYWIVGFDLGDGWPRAGEFDSDTRWEVMIEGRPSLRVVFDARDSFAEAPAPGQLNAAAAITTAMAVVNRLHAVHAAAPGLLTAHDLPQPRYAG